MNDSHDKSGEYDAYDDSMDETQLVDANMFDETQLASGSIANQYLPHNAQTDVEGDRTAITTPESLALGVTDALPPRKASAKLDPFASAPDIPVPAKHDPFSGGGAISDPNFGWGEESEVSEVDNEPVFSETSVLPIQTSDVDASNLNKSIDGRFTLMGMIGEGGMGRVYRAKQTSVGRDVAIKLLRSDMSNNQEVRERFLREAQLISGFSHPNIVHLVDFGETKEGQLYLAMEFVNGKTLADVFSKQKFQPQFVLEMARQVASALIEAHSQGVVHRDLKPDNIFLTRIVDGSVQFKVLDFGVAKTSTSGLTATGTVYGTPTYMAPEQAQGLEVSAQTDLYAVGVMMYECLTGRVPFSGQPLQVMLKHVKDDPPYLLDLAPHLPDEVVEIVHSLLAKDPADRIATATALCDTIEHVMNLNGWNRTYRLPAGPLLVTTKEWHLGEGAAAAAGGFQMDGLAFDSVSGLKKRSDNKPKAKKGGVIPKPKFENIELDLPQAPPPSSALQPRPQRTQDRAPARRVERVKREDNSNVTLGLIFAILVIVAGALGFGIYSGKLKMPTFSAGPVEATGDAQVVLQAVQDQGWEIPFVSSTNVGTIRIQATKAARNGAVVEVAVYACESERECYITFGDIVLPAVGYLKGRTLVRLEPMSESVSNTDMSNVVQAIQSAYPGGSMSTTRF